MPVVRPVTLIAVVALTMGLALDVIGGAHRGHVAPECWVITKAPADPFVPPSPCRTKDTRRATFLVWCEQTVDAIAQGRDLAGFAKVGRRPFRQKIFWFSEGYSWRRDPQPRLELTGQPVDSPASALLKL